MIAEPERPRALHPVGAAIILAAMAGATAWGLLQFRPPAPRDEGRQGFNTTRAFEHLRVIARAPHPTGSAENRRVARYLAASLARYGLETDVQTSQIVQWFRTDDSVPPSREVRITNILGRLRGSNRDAVLLAAHYDSVPAGPGAGDNGAAVASLLETARILVADPTPRNDLIILLEDAEELGFLGAEQFVSEHPWARNVRFVVNFDARGSGGALLLGESTTPTAALADILRSARPPPYAISTSGGRLLSVLTRRSALTTDFHVFVRDGAAGLNFVFVGGADDYHTPNDSVSNLDRGTLFHVGSTALDLARAAATRDLRAPSGGQVVFLTIGPFFVTYPSPIAWVVVGAAAALLVAAAWLGLRSGRVQAAGVTAGFGAGIITLLLSGALAAGLVRVVEQVHGVDFPPIFPPVGGFGSQGWYMLGMGAASIAIAADPARLRNEPVRSGRRPHRGDRLGTGHVPRDHDLRSGALLDVRLPRAHCRGRHTRLVGSARGPPTLLGVGRRTCVVGGIATGDHRPPSDLLLPGGSARRCRVDRSPFRRSHGPVVAAAPRDVEPAMDRPRGRSGCGVRLLRRGRRNGLVLPFELVQPPLELLHP